MKARSSNSVPIAFPILIIVVVFTFFSIAFKSEFLCIAHNAWRAAAVRVLVGVCWNFVELFVCSFMFDYRKCPYCWLTACYVWVLLLKMYNNLNLFAIPCRFEYPPMSPKYYPFQCSNNFYETRVLGFDY